MLTKAKSGFIYIVAALAAIFLYTLILSTYPVFSADGILYLQQAKVLTEHGLSQAVHVFNWPFYAIFIASTAKLLHISLLHAAYFIDLVLFTLTILFFVYLTRLLNYSTRLQWIALFVILFFRPFNKYAHYILRDFGYWAFVLLSVCLLIRFVKSPRWSNAILWSVAVIIAALFRIEALGYLLFMPLLMLLLIPGGLVARVYGYIKLNIITIVGVAIILSFFSLHHLNQFNRIGDFLSALSSPWHMLSRHYSHVIVGVSKSLPSYARDYTTTILFTGVAYVVVLTFLSVLTLPYILLLLYGVAKRCYFHSRVELVVWASALYSVLFILFYSFVTLNFVSRYCVMSCLILSAFVPPAIAKFYRTWSDKTKKHSLGFHLYGGVIALLLLAMVISSLFHIGPSKRYIYNAALWVKRHTTSNTRLYTNSGRIAFLTNRPSTGWQCLYVPKGKNKQQACFKWKQLTAKPWQGYDYLILKLTKKNKLAELNQKINLKPIKVFSNDGKKIVIYRLVTKSDTKASSAS